jgi:hypothetical protein
MRCRRTSAVVERLPVIKSFCSHSNTIGVNVVSDNADARLNPYRTSDD